MQINVLIAGLGNVGRRVIELVYAKGELLRARYDLDFVIRGVADSSGGARMDSPELVARVLSDKAQGKLLAGVAPTADVLNWVRSLDAELFVDLTPTNVKTGEPGLGLMRAALERRMNIVTANKGPLVLAFQDLTGAAERQGVRLRYSATVTGGLPTLNVGRRDLGACEILGFEGVVNGTTNYILTRMTEGESFESALKHAQDVGHAEADPSLDIDGWDAANKLVIIANAVLRQPTRLDDVEVTGIRGVTRDELKSARANGRSIKLVARAEKDGGRFRLSVAPASLAASHPLAQVGAEMMGVIYRTDINGDIFASISERDPYPTAAAVLRDMIDIYC